jgi:hypothetical protein
MGFKTRWIRSDFHVPGRVPEPAIGRASSWNILPTHEVQEGTSFTVLGGIYIYIIHILYYIIIYWYCDSVARRNRSWVPPHEVWAKRKSKQPFCRGCKPCSQWSDPRIPHPRGINWARMAT